MIVGGCALAVDGHPRHTDDLDFWTGTNPINAEKIIQSLKDFGFGYFQLAAEDFTVPNQIVPLGYPPRRIDLLNGISGVDFRQCCERQLVVLVDGLELPFISLEDFKINKVAAGRPKYLADLESLR